MPREPRQYTQPSWVSPASWRSAASWRPTPRHIPASPAAPRSSVMAASPAGSRAPAVARPGLAEPSFQLIQDSPQLVIADCLGAVPSGPGCLPPGRLAPILDRDLRVRRAKLDPARYLVRFSAAFAHHPSPAFLP